MKKLLSLILTLALIAGVSVIGANAQQSKDNFHIIENPAIDGSETIGFTNPEGWENVYAYAYCSQPNWCGTTENAPYPGEKVEKTFVKGYGEIYTYTFASGLFEDVIFNDGTMEEPNIDLYKGRIFELLDIENNLEYEYYYDEIYEHYLSTADETPEYVLVWLESNMVSPILTIDILGDYVLKGYNAYYPFEYGYGVYLPKEDKVMSIEKAYREGVQGIKAAFEKIPRMAILIGDSNRDGKLSIKDSTLIQKVLAKMQTIYLDDLSDWNLEGKLPIGYTTDFNRDGRLTIQDATAIQKHLAKIEPELDEELQLMIDDILALGSEAFTDDSIIITLNGNYNPYTPYDFPEYDFERVEQIGGIYNEYDPDVYALYLKNPGTENIIEAIKAIWHRLDKDIEYIEINAIAYPD